LHRDLYGTDGFDPERCLSAFQRYTKFRSSQTLPIAIELRACPHGRAGILQAFGPGGFQPPVSGGKDVSH
jgi:hypothetical protein